MKRFGVLVVVLVMILSACSGSAETDDPQIAELTTQQIAESWSQAFTALFDDYVDPDVPDGDYAIFPYEGDVFTIKATPVASAYRFRDGRRSADGSIVNIGSQGTLRGGYLGEPVTVMVGVEVWGPDGTTHYDIPIKVQIFAIGTATSSESAKAIYQLGEGEHVYTVVVPELSTDDGYVFSPLDADAQPFLRSNWRRLVPDYRTYGDIRNKPIQLKMITELEKLQRFVNAAASNELREAQDLVYDRLAAEHEEYQALIAKSYNDRTYEEQDRIYKIERELKGLAKNETGLFSSRYQSQEIAESAVEDVIFILPVMVLAIDDVLVQDIPVSAQKK